MPRADPASERHSSQDQSDPLQSLAGHELPVFRLGADREVCRFHQFGRLRLADPHAARPRHSRRLRPVEVGIGAHAQNRTAGLRSHDDRQPWRGLRSMILGLRRPMRLLWGYLGACVLMGFVLACVTAWTMPGMAAPELSRAHRRTDQACDDRQHPAIAFRHCDFRMARHAPLVRLRHLWRLAVGSGVGSHLGQSGQAARL